MGPGVCPADGNDCQAPAEQQHRVSGQPDTGNSDYIWETGPQNPMLLDFMQIRAPTEPATNN